MPETGLPFLSVTVTASRIGSREPMVVEIPSAAPVAIASGWPALFWSV